MKYQEIDELDEYFCNLKQHIYIIHKICEENGKIDYKDLIMGLQAYKHMLENDEKIVKDYFAKFFNGSYEKHKQLILFFIDVALFFTDIGYKVGRENDENKNKISN